jgi:4-amino-4-deoxy-L-arabinose transferase-like glycosyltransferase
MPIQTESRAPVDVRAAAGRFANSRLMLVVAISIYLLFALFELGKFDLGSDEGGFGLGALNIMHDVRQLAIVSERAASGPGHKPYMHPLLLAGPLAILGPSAFSLRLTNVILLLLAGIVLYGTLRQLRATKRLASITAALFLVNPATITYARTVIPEPALVFWGCIGLYCAVRYYNGPRWYWAVLSGAALGCGFLCKLWLIGSFVAACGLLCIFPGRRYGMKVSIRGAIFLAIPLLVIGASHLLAVWLMTPADMPYWLSLYFGVSARDRFAGQGYDPQLWIRPWWLYGMALFRATFFAFPLLIGGGWRLLRRAKPEMIAVTAILLSPVILLSVFTVKETAYMSPIYPAVALLLALGCQDYVQELRSRLYVVAAVLSIGMAIAFVFLYHQSLKVLLALGLLYSSYLVASFVFPLRRFALGLSGAALLASCAFVSYTTPERHTFYRDIGYYFKTALEKQRPNQISYISPEFGAIGFYFFRSGEYWDTYYFHKDTAQFAKELQDRVQVFYVVDPSGKLYGSRVSPQKMALLIEQCRDVTREIEKATGRPIPVHVFVPNQNRH